METVKTPIWTRGDRIRKAREFAGLKQADLAALLHVGRSTIAGWENDLHRPSYTDLAAIAEHASVPFEWIENGSYDSSNTAEVLDGQDARKWYDQQLFAVAA